MAGFNYPNIIHAVVHGENRTFDLKGTYVREYGPRIVSINGFNVDFYPAGNLIYIQHQDRPGVIGKMGQLLAEHNVNIATMQVGRKEEGGEAIMMVAVDKVVDDKVLTILETIEEINFADRIEL